MANETLPCPFCGGEGHYFEGETYGRVICEEFDCCAGPVIHGEGHYEKAIAAWNAAPRREAEPDPPTCPKCRDRGFLCLTPLGPNAGMGGRNCPDCNADGKIPWRFTALKQRDEEAE